MPSGTGGPGYTGSYPLGYAQPSSRPRLLPVGQDGSLPEVGLLDLIDALYNAAAIRDPFAFYAFGQMQNVQVTPGSATGVSLYKNDFNHPVVIGVRSQMVEDDVGVYLYLGPDNSGRIGAATAPVMVRSDNPRAQVTLPPGAELFGRMSTQAGSAAVRSLIVVAVPLKGLQMFRRGQET